MTVSTSRTNVAKLFNGATTAFPLGADFQFINAADLEVRFIDAAGNETPPKALGDDYQVTGTGMSATGVLHVPLARQAGFVSCRVDRRSALAQDVDFIAGNGAPAEAQERQLDRIVFSLQEQEAARAELEGRALRVPRGEQLAPLPRLELRRGRLTGFGKNGEAAFVTPREILAAIGTKILDDGAWTLNGVLVDDGSWNAASTPIDDGAWG
ncbi:MAG: hypothetical protein M3Q08_03595 [Pseudomonadota bacterium]|nr:hypothetical protein [Pseudomonadota bacterium]